MLLVAVITLFSSAELAQPQCISTKSVAQYTGVLTTDSKRKLKH